MLCHVSVYKGSCGVGGWGWRRGTGTQAGRLADWQAGVWSCGIEGHWKRGSPGREKNKKTKHESNVFRSVCSKTRRPQLKVQVDRSAPDLGWVEWGWDPLTRCLTTEVANAIGALTSRQSGGHSHQRGLCKCEGNRTAGPSGQQSSHPPPHYHHRHPSTHAAELS